MAEATAKVCTVCGLDVSNKPRVKDAAGRYMCQDCFNKAKATRGAQTAPKAPPKPAPGALSADPTDNSFLLDMGSKKSRAEQGTVPCPECGRALDPSSVLCIGCGLNLQTGKRLQVKVHKPEKPQK